MHERIRVEIPAWIIKKRTDIMYLVIDWWNQVAALEKIKDIVRIEANDKFFEVLTENVNAFINDGKIPPSGIETVVMNVADDILANRTPTLRTGDYIAIQQHIRQNCK